MPFYNCHIHIFSAQCAPKRFLEVGLGNFGFLAGPVKSTLETTLGRKITGLLSRLSGKSSSRLNTAARYASFASVGTMSTQEMVFSNILRFYPAEARFVVLSLNMDYMGAGESDLTFQGQVDQIIELRKKYPDQLLPFLSVDPRMGSAREIGMFAKKYVGLEQLPDGTMASRPFVGIKLYPALGFFPFDGRLSEVIQYCSDNDLPIMTHCTPSGAFYVGKISAAMGSPAPICQPTNIQYPHQFTNKGNNTETDVFLYPKNWECLLATYPKLKVCFAHMGGSNMMLQRHDGNSWFDDVKHLMTTYENVYTDISYTLSDSDTWEMIVDLCKTNVPYGAGQTRSLGDRVLFGTDYFMTEQEDSEKNLAQKFPNWLLTPGKGMSTAEANERREILRKLTEENPVRYLSSQFFTP
ncbi:MAG: amidohydrolase family protein [Bacteroidota bacterium]